MYFFAGNADTLERVLYCVRMLRHVHHSKLPVQVFHFPSERQPEDSVLVKELTELGGEMIEAVGAQRDETRLKNVSPPDQLLVDTCPDPPLQYHLKALSIVQAPWREVLYLDSDNSARLLLLARCSSALTDLSSVPAIDPEYMFEAPPYKRLRSMFWPDYWCATTGQPSSLDSLTSAHLASPRSRKTAATNPIWAILGIRCRDEFEQEAGQILIDKKVADAYASSTRSVSDYLIHPVSPRRDAPRTTHARGLAVLVLHERRR